MKDKVRKKYHRKTIKLLETKLSSGYLIKGTNTRQDILIKYTGPF